MEETLKQVGGLLLAAIPTVVLFLLVMLSYVMLVHRPLTRVLAERHARGEGAIEKARADIAQADARTAEYEQKIRDARLAIFKAAEDRRRKSLEARANAIAQARARAEDLVHQARLSLEGEAAGARRTLEAESERLAQQIIQTILKPAVLAGGGQG
jgi:F-type H+-transporting ATPase subunit b